MAGYVFIEARTRTYNQEVKFKVRENSPSDAIVLREMFEENVYEVFDGDLQGSGVVLDIGANIGAFSLYAATLFPEARNSNNIPITVYAYEPEENNFGLLLDNIELNNFDRYIIPVRKAVGDRRRRSWISNEHGGSMMKEVVHSSQLDEKKGDATFCQVITLQDVLAQHKLHEVDVLKIDVEGYEGRIILNAPRETLNSCKYIVIEYDQHSKDFGEILTKLSETHQLKVVGSHERGANIYAKRYQ